MLNTKTLKISVILKFKMKNKGLLFFVLAILLIFIDQITKALAYTSGFGNFLSALRPIIGKELFPNSNFAFSIPLPHLLIYSIYVLLLAGLIFWYTNLKNKTFLLSLGLTLILAGALSNIGDRLFLGYVRDFIYIFWGNVFNLADLYIIAGIILLLI